MYVISYNKSENKSDTTSSETKCEVNEDRHYWLVDAVQKHS